MELFPNIYPIQKSVNCEMEKELIGIMIKSVMFSRPQEALLCRGLIIDGQDVAIYSTVNLTISGLLPILGYDLELANDEREMNEDWNCIKDLWSLHFASEPVHVQVLHEDIKRKVNAMVFPMKTVTEASRYMENVKGALSFGDFCPDSGCYLERDGNTPALYCGIMFGRVYFVPKSKLNSELKAFELVYDHERSESEALVFDNNHMAQFYKAACLKAVFHLYHDESLRSASFAHRFPYCTEQMVQEMTVYRKRLNSALNTGLAKLPKQAKKILIPILAPDIQGQQHEVTCISLVIINSHVSKTSATEHRKKLIVLYNKCKVKHGEHPEADKKLASSVGINDVRRIQIYPCVGELGLLEQMLRLLHHYEIDLLYVYNAEFDIRLIEQRVQFYAQYSCDNRRLDGTYKRRCASLLQSWYKLFVFQDCSGTMRPLLQFENTRYLQLYKRMLNEIGSLLLSGELTETKLSLISRQIEQFNKDKAKIGHLKMNSCGMNIIDLYRMSRTREAKFACPLGKLNDVARFFITQARDLTLRAPKDPRKLSVVDVGYSKMNEMFALGGKTLFAVLVYTLVHSQLCARLAKVLKPVATLFHRCKLTLNIDVLVHGRGETFHGFVQNVHSVQLPQLKFSLDKLRVKSGPVGSRLTSRLRWNSNSESSSAKDYKGKWQGGAVCQPLTGLHYSGPGMGLELCLDFASQYPSIICALNVSPESIIPWPPAKFPHDLSGWVCYRWEMEGFEFATLILKYDPDLGHFVREPAVFAHAVEHYLNQRALCKRKMNKSDISEAERVYCKTQQEECKVLANSFYGTAPALCGALISGHGRRQLAVVNRCISSFYQQCCPVIYGDTDSVMFSTGYGPKDTVEVEVPNTVWAGHSEEFLLNELKNFSHFAIKAVLNKFENSSKTVPAFLQCVHKALIEDSLERMYYIGKDNTHTKVIRDPKGTYTEDGFPVYGVQGTHGFMDVTRSFVANRKVKLEHENSCSVYCHISKKAYVALAHNSDCAKGAVHSLSVKVRGLAAIKSMRSPCDCAVTDTFIACVLMGDCIKLERHQVSCFSPAPWHELKPDDVILYFEQEPQVDSNGRWLQVSKASSFLMPYKVQKVITLPLDSGYCAVSVTLVSAVAMTQFSEIGNSPHGVTVFSLYKDWKYCMNHIFSYKEGILRDLLMYKASELIASKMGVGFFPWSSLIKSERIKNITQETLNRLMVPRECIKASYAEIVTSDLQKITGLSVKPVECQEFHKCNPCDIAFYRYPLDLGAQRGCFKAMFGDSLLCEAGLNLELESIEEDISIGTNSNFHEGQLIATSVRPKLLSSVNLSSANLIPHPYLPWIKCFSNSRLLLAHSVDYDLVNTHAKLTAYCIIDLCISRHMYSAALDTQCLKDCKRQLLIAVNAIRERLKRAHIAFHSLMNNCPEHMIPILETQELEHIKLRREVVTRLPGEKIQACFEVVVKDMCLDPDEVYKNISVSLGHMLTQAMVQNVISVEQKESKTEPFWNGFITLTLPRAILREAGITGMCGKLLIARSEVCESSLVDLASLLYQSVLVMQLFAPENFSTVGGLYSDSVLQIMPFSCEDENVLQTWIEVFQKRKYQFDHKVVLGKRKHCYINPDYKYHCVGCKNFYLHLFMNPMAVSKLTQCMYSQDKIRKFGMCVSERWWLQ